MKRVERIKKLELKAQKYRRLRKVFRVLEAVTIAALIIVFMYCASNPLLDIIGCLAAVVIVPESFLAVSRSTLKTSIKNEKMICEQDFECLSNYLYSVTKEEEEKMGIEWSSQQMKMIDEIKEFIEKLESIKGLVTF